MKSGKILLVLMLMSIVIFTGCSAGTSADSSGYRQVSAEEAKSMMDSQTGYVILDVRTQEEFDSGYIPDAVLLPYDEVKEKAESLLSDKDQLILVYCRSGNRSKKASSALVELGYTNVVEFGGINAWPYETVKE